ncbi:MAG: hypothetical protein QXP41_00465 [Candidatus Nitrosocaldus sp.]
MSGVVSYNDGTWTPIDVVFDGRTIATLDGSGDAMCKLAKYVTQLFVDLGDSLSHECDYNNKIIVDYTLSLSGLVTYDDGRVVPYLSLYMPNKHNVIFNTQPIIDVINVGPQNIKSYISQAFASVNIKKKSNPPSAPADLVAFASNSYITLNWVASPGATSYNIKRSLISGGPYAIVGTSSTNSFTNTGLTNGTTYYYVVTAVGPGGESTNSNEANGTPNLADNVMQSVGFSVPYSVTVAVSGGGSALQNAIDAAGPGTRLMIQDSMAYDPITISNKTNLTIDVLSGKTPSITALPGAPNHHCVSFGPGNSGIAIKKMRFIGSANENTLSQIDNGLVWGCNSLGMTSIDRLIIEDCTFTEPAPAIAGVPGIQLIGTDGSVHTNVWIHRCVFKNNAAGPNVTGYGYGACTIGGFSNVFIQNCKIIRENSVIARSSSHMRGVVCKSLNVYVENVLCEDLGTAGSNEAFKHNDEAIFGTAVGTSTWRNNVAYNCKRGYRLSLPGATMNSRNNVFYNDIAGITSIAVRGSNLHSFKNGIIMGAGDGTAFELAIVEDHNDVFNVADIGKALDVTDYTIDPAFHNVANRNFTADATSLQTGGSDGGPIGVRYTPTGEAIIWATP